MHDYIEAYYNRRLITTGCIFHWSILYKSRKFPSKKHAQYGFAYGTFLNIPVCSRMFYKLLDENKSL